VGRRRLQYAVGLNGLNTVLEPCLDPSWFTFGSIVVISVDLCRTEMTGAFKSSDRPCRTSVAVGFSLLT